MQQCRCLQGPSPLLSGASGASGAPGAQNCQALFPGRIPVPGLSGPCFEQAQVLSGSGSIYSLMILKLPKGEVTPAGDPHN